MSLRKKSISLFIAAAVVVSCLATPISASAATVGTAVISTSEVAVLESSTHTCVKSVEKEAGSGNSDLGFTDTYVADKEAAEQAEVEAESTETTEKDGSVEFVNTIEGKTSKVVVKNNSVTVKCSDYITVSKEELTLGKKDTHTLTATIIKDKYKANGVTWTSSNNSVATVSSNGVVTGVGKGSCFITAAISGTNIKVQTEVTVRDYKLMEVKTTAYCGCKKCNGKWYGSPTASGTDYQVGRTIAVDKNVIKLGTKVEIDGKVYIAEDTGVKGKHIDIYHDSHSAALKYGVKVKIVKVYL